MKIPTDNLFQLIQAMTASEKRYFKRHYASERSITTELFDFINGMNTYNEGEVKANFKNSKVAKNLKVYKVQLSELLLKSLTSYHNKKSIRSKIRIGLEEVELLMFKQLYSLAYSRIKKIKELCLKYEELEYIFSVLFFEILLTSFFDVKLQPSNNPMLEELDQYTDKIKNTYRLKKINFTLNDLSNNKLTHQLDKEKEDIFTQTLIQEQKKAQQGQLSFNEEYYLNSSLSLFHKLIEVQPEQEYFFKKKNVELFEKKPHFIENHASYYYAALYNFLISCRKLGKHQELATGIQKIKELAKQQPLLERNLIFVYYLEIKHSFQKGDFNNLVKNLEPVAVKHIKKYEQNQENLPALCFIYFALTYMVLEQAPKVQFYLRRLQAMSKHLNPSYAKFFDLFELISHFETGDLTTVQNLLQSFRRKIQKGKSTPHFYKNMLDFFQQLLKTEKEERATLIQELRTKMQEAENDGVLNLFRAFFLEEWLEALQQQKSFSDFIKSIIPIP